VIPSLESLHWRDFLARPALQSPAPEVLDAVARQPILITGAGGSIGAALALHLAHPAPSALLLLESAENNLCRLERAWTGTGRITSGSGTVVLGSAGDRALLEDLFAAHGPRLVFHAAAHKHVPLLEQQPFAAIVNNIFVTETVAAVAAAHGARVVLLSTDKAVAPASVMGASKRVAEEMVLAAGGTVLRLGNVLASSGSVAEVFARQIARGAALTVTDPAARRYFLTLDEAVNSLLIAAAYSDSRALLVPALSATHNIVELARFMARELAPGREISLRFTGLRPGDKLIESLWDGSDPAEPIGNGDMVRVQTSRPAHTQFKSGLAALRAAVHERDVTAALAQLCALVPGYQPSQAVLALARKNATRVCA
jgi:O-antigen biosynthesis protein WbqV